MSELGLLVMSYGTARDLDDVEAYYTHIRRGSPPTPELLEELKDRYRAIGGRSPLAEITQAQVRGLEAELNAEADPGGPRFRAFNGQKHQAPYIEDAVAAMAEAGIERAVGLVLAPHYSRFSIGQYVERAEKAAAPLGIEMTFVESYAAHAAFVAFVADRVRDVLAEVPDDVRDRSVVVFSAHSLPARILTAGDPYADELRSTAEAVARGVGLPPGRVRTAWMSAGRTPEPWLGPDVTEVVRDLASRGVPAMVACPVGFVSDHLEVLYDVDVELAETARRAGVLLVRTRSPNDDTAFLRVLATVVREHLAEAGWMPG
jgi:protoporphyrin/coproporphyrin ferrochelatase